MSEAKPQYFKNLQFLRGLSALLVVIFHMRSFAEIYTIGFPVLNWLIGDYGRLGVDVFFILSGFLISITTQNNISSIQFFIKRTIRVVPLYWLMTFVFLGVYFLLGPSRFGVYKFDWSHFLASLFFIPMKNSDGSMTPIISYGWSLNYEMCFYFLYAFGLRLNDIKRVGYFTLSYFLIFLLAKILPVENHLQAVFEYLSNSIFIEFIVGVALAYLYKNHETKLLTIAKLLIPILFVWSFLNIHFQWTELRIFLLGPIALTLFLLFLILDIKNINFIKLTYLGDISYSLYLIQAFTLPIFLKISGIISKLIFFDVNLVMFLALSISLVAASISYEVVEKKSMYWFKKLLINTR